MHMSYWFGTNIGDLFFQGFTVTSVPGFISTCFGVASLAILFEGLRVVLVSVRQQAAELAQLNTIPSDGQPTEVSSLLFNRQNRLLQSNFKKCLTICNQLILFTTHEIFAYALMLLVMTYNGYFTIAAVLGAGIGFFIFSPVLMGISLRRRGTMHPRLFCATCLEKSKFEENDEENASMEHPADGVPQVVVESSQTEQTQTRDESKVEGPHSSIQVAMVHSTNEEVC